MRVGGGWAEGSGSTVPFSASCCCPLDNRYTQVCATPMNAAACNRNRNHNHKHTQNTALWCARDRSLRPPPPCCIPPCSRSAQLSSAQLTEDAVGARLAPVLDDGLLLLRGRRRVGRHCCGSCCCCCCYGRLPVLRVRRALRARCAAALAALLLRTPTTTTRSGVDDRALSPSRRWSSWWQARECSFVDRAHARSGAKLRNEEERQKEGSRCREVVLRFLLSLCARPHAVC